MAALSACAQTRLMDESPSIAPNTECQSEKYEILLWQKISSVDRATLPMNTRIIFPEDPVTMDLSPARLNVIVGELGRIEALSCG